MKLILYEFNTAEILKLFFESLVAIKNGMFFSLSMNSIIMSDIYKGLLPY